VQVLALFYWPRRLTAPIKPNLATKLIVKQVLTTSMGRKIQRSDRVQVARQPGVQFPSGKPADLKGREQLAVSSPGPAPESSTIDERATPDLK
jgi:hypothetical protein